VSIVLRREVGSNKVSIVLGKTLCDAMQDHHCEKLGGRPPGLSRTRLTELVNICFKRFRLGLALLCFHAASTWHIQCTQVLPALLSRCCNAGAGSTEYLSALYAPMILKWSTYVSC
jgi:hypothetical protein